MNAKVEPYGLVVTFTHRPSDVMIDGLRSHSFRWNRDAGCWFRTPTRHAATVIAALRRLAALEPFEGVGSTTDTTDDQNAAFRLSAGTP